MALILSIDTATDVCSAALHDHGQVLHALEVHVPQAHGSQLAVLINQLFKVTERKEKELTAVAISSGPGSYTGLRIGVSTAKGICVGLHIPLIAIDTLELMAYQVRNLGNPEDYLCPMIDARRMEVYCLLMNTQLEKVTPVEAKVVDKYSFEDVLARRRILFFGSGAEKCKSVLTHPHAMFLDHVFPHAGKLGELAYEYWVKGNTVDLITFEPYYLKEFLAKKAKPLW